MNQFRPVIFLILVPIILSASTSCARQVPVDIKKGMSKQEVSEQLGKPTSRTIGVVPSGHLFGPQENLKTLLNPGDSYEEWRYDSRKKIRQVWFDVKTDRVISTLYYSRDVAFEPQTRQRDPSL